MKAAYLTFEQQYKDDLVSAYGIDTVFIGIQDMDKDRYAFLQKSDVKIYIVLPTFLEGSCIAAPYQQQRLHFDISLALGYHPQGILFDHFSFERAWLHGEVMHTCSYCKSISSQKRVAFLAEMAKDIRAHIPDLPIGYFAIPYMYEEEKAFMDRSGQILSEVSEPFDVVIPMLYNRLIHKDVSYIRSFIEYAKTASKKPVLPIVQAIDMRAPDTLSADDMKEIYTQAMNANEGVAWFTLDMAISSGKDVTMRELFTS